MPDLEFANKDIETILNDMITGYEKAYYEKTGQMKKLYPGDPIRIFLYSQALREFQLRQLIDFSAKQNLLKYSTGNYLDELGKLTGVSRLLGKYSTVTIKFLLSANRPIDTIINKGTRISTSNGIYFETTKDLIISAGQLEGQVVCVCLQEGTIGNGFTPGQINVLVDPIPYVSSISNIDTSTGGAEIESDEKLRDRIRLSPEGYSVAGPSGAYEYFTKKYSSSIQDILITSLAPGNVDIYILMQKGDIPNDDLLNGLKEYLSDKKRRPLTDKVNVNAPTQVSYDLDLTYYISNQNTEQELIVKNKVTLAINDYILWQKNKIGRDINPSELVAKIIAAGGKRVEITKPVFKAISETEVAALNNKTVNYGGVENG